MANEEVSTLDTVRDLKNQEPFVPFWIVMTSGDRYLIEDPDALAIGSSQMFYYPRPPGGGIHLRTSQVAAIEENASKRRTRRKAS
jgi:hypothetical protein